MERVLWWADLKQRCKELLVVAIAFTLASLVLSAAGFGTNEWTVVKVDRLKLRTLAVETADTQYFIKIHSDYNYFDRKRGLFQTCFPDNNDTNFLKNEELHKSGKCLYDPAIKFSSPKSSWGSDYRSRNDMLRAHVALLAVGMAFLLLSLMSGLVSCCTISIGILLLSSLCSVLGFFSSFTGMIIYHIYDDNEIHNLDYKPFVYFWSKDTVLNTNSSFRYGFSFYLAWVGVAACLIASVLFWGAFFTWKEHSKNKRSQPRLHKHDYDIDDYGYGRSRKREKSKQPSPPSDNIYDYYLHSRDHSYSGSNKLLVPVSSKRLTPNYKPYDYYDYYNLYGSGGIYPY